MSNADDLVIRRATSADAGVIGRHRADMFRDMGELPGSLRAALEDATRRQLAAALENGEYVGWLAETRDGQVVAGGGVLLRARLPRAGTVAGVPQVLSGREAIVYNMFTEPGWRRQGLARRLMHEILSWARGAASGVDAIVLHASEDGRPLYASLGFVPTTEMRFGQPLR